MLCLVMIFQGTLCMMNGEICFVAIQVDEFVGEALHFWSEVLYFHHLFLLRTLIMHFTKVLYSAFGFYNSICIIINSVYHCHRIIWFYSTNRIAIWLESLGDLSDQIWTFSKLKILLQKWCSIVCATGSWDLCLLIILL